jgi:hypothetical protein
MTIDEAAQLKQKYWQIEAKYERWPPCPCNKYTAEQFQKMDADCDREINDLIRSLSISEKNMARFRDFMSLSYAVTPMLMAEMVEACR